MPDETRSGPRSISGGQKFPQVSVRGGVGRAARGGVDASFGARRRGRCGGVGRGRRRGTGAADEDELGRGERRLVDLRRERDRLNDALRRREAELIGRRSLIERLQRGRRAERGWNDELRAQLQREHASRSGLEERADPRDLILRAAIKLVEAEKGLLLSREDEDADGRLDLVCAHGFEHDPAQGSVVQRFAREVLERDQIVREDAPARGSDPVDAEIENLVAIPLYLRGRFGGVIVCANRRGGFEELDETSYWRSAITPARRCRPSVSSAISTRLTGRPCACSSTSSTLAIRCCVARPASPHYWPVQWRDASASEVTNSRCSRPRPLYATWATSRFPNGSCSHRARCRRMSAHWSRCTHASVPGDRRVAGPARGGEDGALSP